MKQKKRLNYLDVAKGIGVCLVILGHMPSIVPEQIRMWIFSFHMPLFFAISGFFAKAISDGRALKNRVIQKFVKLILMGYLSFGLIFLLIDSVILGFGLHEIAENLEELLFGNTRRIIWFFLSLFEVEIIFLIITRISKKLLSQIIMCMLAVALGYALGRMGWNYYRLGSSLYAYGFYYIGFLANRYNVLEMGGKKRYAIATTSLLINIIGTMLFLEFSPSVLDINNNIHHDIFANYAIALGGSYAVICISMMLCKAKGFLALKVLRYVGMNSFFFFPITNYIPETFTTIIQNKTSVAKVASYFIGGLVAWSVSAIAQKAKSHVA